MALDLRNKCVPNTGTKLFRPYADNVDERPPPATVDSFNLLFKYNLLARACLLHPLLLHMVTSAPTAVYTPAIDDNANVKSVPKRVRKPTRKPVMCATQRPLCGKYVRCGRPASLSTLVIVRARIIQRQAASQ
jgi:hypothetical protein